MAGMTTSLTEFATNGNSRTSFYTGHTAVEPRLVIETRKTPTGGSSVLEDVFKTLSSTEDANGEILDSKVLIETKVRRPANGIAADVTAALAVHRDIIASDEFTSKVSTQQWFG